jgi:hypothetical protein
MKKKVLVGMSGGVDSSVAASLLLEQGYDVSGVTLHLYNNEDAGIAKTRTCCSLADVEDARSVASRIGIEHYVFNFGPEFRRDVIGRFARGYEQGETPNPCIDCNRYIKFGKMLERAKQLGFDYIAMGHYARVSHDKKSGRSLLKKGGGYLERPDVCPVFPDAGRIGPYAVSPRRVHQGRGAENSGGAGLRQCAQAGQRGYLLCAGRQLRRFP